MDNAFLQFEIIARNAYQFAESTTYAQEFCHPFDLRNIHPKLPNIVKQLFDDGYYSQASFEAFKFVDKQVAQITNSCESGFKLMMSVFSDQGPILKLTNCKTISEKDEQKGYQFLFAGSMLAIRNPRGHEYTLRDTLDSCLDHLVLASLLLRRLDAITQLSLD